MPILTAFKAISGSYPDIALNPYKYFFEKKDKFGFMVVPFHFLHILDRFC